MSRAIISKIARSITISQKDDTVIDLEINKTIFLNDVPVQIERLIAWLPQQRYVEVELLYKNSRELVRKVKKSARNANPNILKETPYAAIASYYLGENRTQISNFLFDLNLGFSAAALRDFAIHAQIGAVVPREIDNSFSMFSLTDGESNNRSYPELGDELGRAVRYKKSIDDFGL